MADVTGPISTLPGTRHSVKPGTMCDEHPDVPAVAAMQGETDSFGSEIHHCCAACVEAWNKAEEEADHSGTCDWCKKHVDHVQPHRDYTEGSYGPVYAVCKACIKKENENILRELREDEDAEEASYRSDTTLYGDFDDEPAIAPEVEALVDKAVKEFHAQRVTVRSPKEPVKTFFTKQPIAKARLEPMTAWPFPIGHKPLFPKE